MKRIYITLVTLFLLIAAMAYLYFSSISSAAGNSDLSLKVAAQRAGIVYRIVNDKGVLDILNGQQLLFKLIGTEKAELLKNVHYTFQSDPVIAAFLEHKVTYISVLPGKGHSLDFMISTQLSDAAERNAVIGMIAKKRERNFDSKLSSKIQIPGSAPFYIGFEKDVLIVSNEPTVFTTLKDSKGRENNPFSEFILSNDKLTKNSLANLYINYTRLPDLLKAITPNINREEFEEIRDLYAFSHLSYNFSETYVFFNGETQLKNDSGYLNLFLNVAPQKLGITSILPSRTANFTLYNPGNFAKWSVQLRSWFDSKKEHAAIVKQVALQNTQYHVVLNDIFPKYASNQFLTFQLEQGQKLGAIALTNGDKVSQLLLDLSDDVDGTVRHFKSDNMLYFYFGQPFRKFTRPYYIIKDNYFICSNYASNLKEFLNDYQENRLLVNDAKYAAITDQLPNTATVLYYLNMGRSSKIANRLIYPVFVKQMSDTAALKNFSAFIFQLSANKESFQTNMLIPSNSAAVKDTLQNKINKNQ